MTHTQPSAHRGFAALRQLARPRHGAERGELCGRAVAPDHFHLMEPTTRRLACACGACAVLFSGADSTRYRRVPRDVQYLPDLRLSDAQWEDLHLPINLAF